MSAGRRPVRPFGLSAYDGVTAEVQRLLAADAHGVAHRHAAGLDEIQMAFADVDDDRPRPIGAGEGDLPAKHPGIDPTHVEPGDLVPMVIDRAIGGGVPERIECSPERTPALACATPKQDRDPGEKAAAIDTRAHCPDIPSPRYSDLVALSRTAPLKAPPACSRRRQAAGKRPRPESWPRRSDSPTDIFDSAGVFTRVR